MANVKDYKKNVQEVIRRYAKERPLPKKVENQLVFDTERDHYQLVNVGWDNDRWIYGSDVPH